MATVFQNLDDLGIYTFNIGSGAHGAGGGSAKKYAFLSPQVLDKGIAEAKAKGAKKKQLAMQLQSEGIAEAKEINKIVAHLWKIRGSTDALTDDQLSWYVQALIYGVRAMLAAKAPVALDQSRGLTPSAMAKKVNVDWAARQAEFRGRYSEANIKSDMKAASGAATQLLGRVAFLAAQKGQPKAVWKNWLNLTKAYQALGGKIVSEMLIKKQKDVVADMQAKRDAVTVLTPVVTPEEAQAAVDAGQEEAVPDHLREDVGLDPAPGTGTPWLLYGVGAAIAAISLGIAFKTWKDKKDAEEV